jgi:methyltransferase (TIGR00027 family)
VRRYSESAVRAAHLGFMRSSVMPISRTSIWAASARAFGAREPDSNLRNPDWLAAEFLGPEERALLAGHPLIASLDQTYDEATQNMEVMGAARMLIVRTRFIDDRFQAALNAGIRQFVIMGAGFDTRAYRFAEQLRDARVIEVDQREIQALKINRIKEVIGEIPAHVTLSPIDFATMQFGDVLAQANFNRDQKTFFVWEGVTMYLPEDSVKATLRWIAGNTAPGSSIVFDYAYAGAIQRIKNNDMGTVPEVSKQAMQRFRDLIAGEPWIFGLQDRNEKEFLKVLGLELRHFMGMNSLEAIEKYLTRTDGTIFASMPATERQGYLILEAVVPG